MVSFLQPWANTRPQSLAFISNLGQIAKIVFSSALTPSVKLLGLISTSADSVSTSRTHKVFQFLHEIE
jgi:hypothetical protein